MIRLSFPPLPRQKTENEINERHKLIIFSHKSPPRYKPKFTVLYVLRDQLCCRQVKRCLIIARRMIFHELWAAVSKKSGQSTNDDRVSPVACGSQDPTPSSSRDAHDGTCGWHLQSALRYASSWVGLRSSLRASQKYLFVFDLCVLSFL